MSDYGQNFGFRRSDESLLSRESRFRVPAGETWLQGQCVEIDPATEGFLRLAAEDAVARPTICGLVLQEEDAPYLTSIYDTVIKDTLSLGGIAAGRLANVVNGAGAKVWLRNTAQVTRADGRVIPAVTMVYDPTDALMVVGAQLGWDGAKWSPRNLADDANLTNFHMEIVSVDASKLMVEATLLV